MINSTQFALLKQNLGVECLNYLLNTTKITDLHNQFHIEEFNFEQKNALSQLHSLTNNWRKDFIENGFGDFFDSGGSWLTIDISIFQNIRKSCNGHQPDFETSNPLEIYLIELLSVFYPFMLIPGRNGIKFPFLPINFVVNSNSINAMIREDDLDKLTNQKDGLDYAFSFETELGFVFYQQPIFFVFNIIGKAFVNSAFRMEYSISQVISELMNLLKKSRELANGEIVEFSYFTGISGICLKNLNSIDLEKDTLRRINGRHNPYSLITNLISQCLIGDRNFDTGCILESKYTDKLAKVNLGKKFSTSYSKIFIEYETKKFEKFQISVVFTTKIDKGFDKNFVDLGFPFLHVIQDPPQILKNNHAIINEENQNNLNAWLDKLSEVDLSKISIAISRLKQAIFERETPEDSIVDGVIAWESMFSEAFETTFKVTGSISKYMNNTEEERISGFKRLKDLYDLRSKLVHGGKSKLLKSENIEDIRSEVIEIGLICLEKLIQDPKLLPLSPEERVKYILIYS